MKVSDRVPACACDTGKQLEPDSLASPPSHTLTTLGMPPADVHYLRAARQERRFLVPDGTVVDESGPGHRTVHIPGELAPVPGGESRAEDGRVREQRAEFGAAPDLEPVGANWYRAVRALRQVTEPIDEHPHLVEGPPLSNSVPRLSQSRRR
jgi:hypothetical protein